MGLENIEIVLVGTLQSGNIGSVARAMKNMGLSKLTLVNPCCSVDRQAYIMATHGQEILDNIGTCPTLPDAVEGASFVFGTTARDRKFRTFVYPREMAKKAVALARENSVSIVFGPEDKGLSNEELDICSEVVNIPTMDDASSLNIAQAVVIVCYEIFLASEQYQEVAEQVVLAPVGKVEEMYDHMKNAFVEIGFADPENPDHVIGLFKRILTRAGLTEKDVQMVRGVFRQLLWYVNKTKKTGDESR